MNTSTPSERPCEVVTPSCWGEGGVLAVAIAALALAGCDLADPRCVTEADDIQYSTVRGHLDRGEEGAVKLAPAALADGRLTDCEYDDIILYRSDAERDEYARDKRALISGVAQ